MPEQNSSISSFKRFLTGILLPLLCIVIIAVSAFNYLFEKTVVLNSETSGAYKVHRIINETHPDEIAILGSSRAEGGYIPDSIGSNLFNYGLTGSKYDVTLFFLEQECKKKKNRPWIILNLDLDGLTYGIGNPANYIPESDNPELKLLLGAEYRPYHALLATRFYGQYESYVREYLKNRLTNGKFTNKGANLELNQHSADKFAALVAERKRTPSTFNIDPVLRNKLTGLINAHPERTFIFVVAPAHSSSFEYLTNAPEAATFLVSLKAMKNVHVFDFGRLPLADSMFLNTSHINYKGAAVFCHALKDSLVSIGVR